MTTRPRFTFHLPLPAFALAMLGVLMVATQSAQAQTITVLHNFTGGADGSYPTAGVTFDQQGRIYGTASSDGRHDSGVVFRLVHEGEGWTLSPIYSFGAQDHDGIQPYARVVFGPGGLLYGTTNQAAPPISAPSSACDRQQPPVPLLSAPGLRPSYTALPVAPMAHIPSTAT